ncbi:tRNA (adenosine(37)-N6)-threonylcarbamoyltransferase complex ATPase subunit type 1 TsaE [Ornithinibacillus halophilus]|uniref:tRNA threonylcarbamoyladenosine biosynthesis protein TsaE n=1 Tax=Ornithinibacillus halophilus TaxID=930117 RepID=A0A1M5HGL0_9BACI|nr:tRNA (adenosine(37)-N6)-threonylcarbamoyltransferase complex ATPase subunit type 1 TsaE [Ornithinibacillus halophilus]SHG15073.1 tRNA threonylcarbamoyladenosine biosynthesis protein TsaE [Ornithinibacillus halophilus]
MEKHQIITETEIETKRLAENLAQLLKPGDVITLEGDLGAGKTTFTKGLANGLGIKRTVSSPTFTIVKEYEGELPLYHMDVYRLEGSEEDIGFDEYFNGSGITVVEWAHFIEDYLPEERLNVNIEYKDEHSRVLTFEPIGRHFNSIVRELIG